MYMPKMTNNLLKVVFSTLIIVFHAIADIAYARNTAPIPGPVPAVVRQVIDVDTVTVEAYIWIGQRLAVNVRLRGIDAPEIDGPCPSERKQAKAAKDMVARELSEGKAMLTDIEDDKYGGRVVARILTPDGRSVGQLLLDHGLARPYDGGRKAGWCP